MLRLIARWHAMRKYRYKEEFDAAVSEINARAASYRAAETRAAIAKTRKEADDIDANIKEVDEKLKNGYWECECGREKQVNCGCAGNYGEAIVHIEACPLKDDATKDGQPINQPLCQIQCDCGKPMNYVRRDLLPPKDQYEADKERAEAKKIADDKRAQAARQEPEAENQEMTAKTFLNQAARSREFAELLRKL